MANQSNLYAERAYAEQPTALWSFDDECTYVSYVSETVKDLSSSAWSVIYDSGEAQYDELREDFLNANDPYPPIRSAKTAKISLDAAAMTAAETIGSTRSLKLSTTTGITKTATHPLTVSFYFYSQGSEVKSVSIYHEGQAENERKVFTNVAGKLDEWLLLSTTFSGSISSKKIIVKINYGVSNSGIYTYFINGFSAGINSENYSSYSTGQQLEQVSGVLSSSFYALKSSAYGELSNYAYYVGDNSSKVLYAKNSSVPMVYGASSTTVVSPAPSGGPSLIVPGKGFMNEIGRSQTITFESWIRINSNQTSAPRKIFGPISNSDGLYVDGPFLKLKISDKYASHYVGEWFRPMLVNIEMTNNLFSLIVNGERVASITVDSKTLDLASYSYDYLGFYAHEEVPFVEVDCIGFYPYRVPEVVAKRRFGYGQAVTPPENLATAYSGTQIFADYTFAGYSFDYGYPRLERWGSSKRENTYHSLDILGSPSLQQPEIMLNKTFGRTIADTTEWLSDVIAANKADTDTTPYILLKPSGIDSRWDNVSGYLHLNKLKITGSTPLYAIYAAFKRTGFSEEEQVLVKLQHTDTKDQIVVTLEGNLLRYRYNIGMSSGDIYTTEILEDPEDDSEKTVVVGMNIPALIAYANSKIIGYTTPINKAAQRYKVLGLRKVAKMLSNLNKIELFVGGDYLGKDEEVKSTFTGKIYGLGMLTKISANRFSNLFNVTQDSLPTGLADSNYSISTLLAGPNTYLYGLKEKSFGSTKSDSIYSLDVSTHSYWEDYIPISKIAKTATNADGTKGYRTDMIQVSLDYPASKKTKIVSGTKYKDTSSSLVKSYVIFKTRTTPLATYGTDISPELLPESNVIDARSGWAGKKYEVVDGTVIMPPEDSYENYENLVMVTLLEISSKISSTDKVGIRFLEYSAQTYDKATSDSFSTDLAKGIGTRLGNIIYPYSIVNNKYSYGSYSPYAINKSSTPYLYLTDKSGIKVLNSYSDSQSRGIYVPINKAGSDNYNISSVVMMLNFNDSEFPESKMTVAEISDAKYGKTKVTLERLSSSTSNRARLRAEYLLNGVWVEHKDVSFYVNGALSASPVLNLNEWSFVGMLFLSTLDFSNMTNGNLQIVGSLCVSHVSYYQIDSERLLQQIVSDEWSDTLSLSPAPDPLPTELSGYSPQPPGGVWDNTWGSVLYNTDKRGTWLLVSLSNAVATPSITPENIYKIYTGTNKIILNTDNTGIKMGSYQYDLYKDAKWQPSLILSA
jgi:hypothetical protein